MRPALFALICLALFTSSGCLHRAVKRQAAADREANYQRELVSYKDALKPGVSRKEVEQYLKDRGAQYSWIWGMQNNATTSNDILKIGQEKSPHWYCSWEDVDIAFEFEATGTPSDPLHHAAGLPNDRLKDIILWRQLQNCL